MSKDWESVISSANENGESTWKEELAKITNYEDICDLYNYVSEQMVTNYAKFHEKSNRSAARRARVYGQKVKDVTQQIRINIQNAIK